MPRKNRFQSRDPQVRNPFVQGAQEDIELAAQQPYAVANYNGPRAAGVDYGRYGGGGHVEFQSNIYGLLATVPYNGGAQHSNGEAQHRTYVVMPPLVLEANEPPVAPAQSWQMSWEEGDVRPPITQEHKTDLVGEGESSCWCFNWC